MEELNFVFLEINELKYQVSSILIAFFGFSLSVLITERFFSSRISFEVKMCFFDVGKAKKVMNFYLKLKKMFNFSHLKSISCSESQAISSFRLFLTTKSVSQLFG